MEAIIVILIVVGIIAATKVKRTKDGRIKKESVKLDLVLEELDDFAAGLNKRAKKNGYTENSIQKELEQYLYKRFEHVTPQYKLEGTSSAIIDFDISGKVGIEIKVADSVFSARGLHGLIGQISIYSDRKYGDDIIVVLFAEKRHRLEVAKMREIEESVKRIGATFVVKDAPIDN